MTSITLLLVIAPAQLWAVQALEIKPKTVYIASYCAELLKLNPSAVGDETKQIIMTSSADFIGGGDNLSFASVGVEDARRRVLDNSTGIASFSVEGNIVQYPHATQDLNQCAIDLVAFYETYSAYSCGYGRGRRESAEEVNVILGQLGLERADNPLISEDLFQEEIER